MQNSPATKASSPSAATAASPVNAALRAVKVVVVLAAVVIAGAARRAVVPNLVIARAEVSAAATVRDEPPRAVAAPPAPLPDLNVAFIPEERGVEQLARQIKVTGRAYPLFQIALLILDKAERYSVQLTKKKAEGDRATTFRVRAR